jgi:diguanylate cyclase (GGDEF)-like protein
MPFERPRTDFRLPVLALLGGSAAIGILPFVWYRFSNGQIAAGIVDIGIACVLIGVIVYAWRGGSIDRAARICVIASTLGCIGVTYLVGLAGVAWTYPLVLGAFLLVGPRMASFVSLSATVVIAVIAVSKGVLSPGLPAVIYVATALLVGVFSLLFAQRARVQQAALEELAARDPLTGALNRRAMNRELQLAVEARARHDARFGLAIFDIDHFKRINDVHGHEAGDQVLVAFVRVVRSNIRKLDQVYRMGGEEFLVLFPAVDEASLPSVCETLLAAIRQGISCAGEAVTASAGCAMLARDEDVGMWLARADAALYRAKHEGRNRVEAAQPMPLLAMAAIGSVEPGSSTLARRGGSGHASDATSRPG